jgi:transposase
MSQKEIDRLSVLTDLRAGKINGPDAAKQLSLSTRQIRRLKARVRKHGAKGLIHKNRGKESNRKLSKEVLKKIKKQLEIKYQGFGPTFAREKLAEDCNLMIGKETLRLLMIDLELWKPKPQKSVKIKHVWRPRKGNYGEMQQFDGSYHAWFGAEESCLLLSVDDATGKITHAEFALNEGVRSVFAFWLKYFSKNGFPLAVYLDKFSTYKINHKNAVDNADMITQFQRAMTQVGIKPITAHSPEAKGRVERMFETLQDRLVKELRLAGITNAREANSFLTKYIPKFNDRFSVVPSRKKDLHKRINRQIKKKLPQIFSIQSERTIMNDYTIMFKTKFIQLTEIQPTTVYKKDIVTVEEHLDGTIKINLKGHYLNYKLLPERPQKQNIPVIAISRQKSSWKPPINHPWRQQPSFARVNQLSNS